jgi:hypothetical protein
VATTGEGEGEDGRLAEVKEGDVGVAASLARWREASAATTPGPSGTPRRSDPGPQSGAVPSPVTFLIKPDEGLQATGHGMTCRPCC